MDSSPSSSKKRVCADADINPVGVLQPKKPRTESRANFLLCIICQQKSNKNLRHATELGKKKLLEVANERRMLHDTANKEVSERLIDVFKGGIEDLDVPYHKECYSSFTHAKSLRKVREMKHTDTVVQEPQHQKQSRRSIPKHNIDWSLCMFCQQGNECQSGKMRNVATLETSNKMITLSQKDTIMRVRLSNISDLVAAEGKYHVRCWVEFGRRMSKLSDDDSNQRDNSDKCMDKLCYQLLGGLSQGYVYDMGDVWTGYEKICESESIQPPQRYISRRSTFYDDIERCVGPKASFVRPMNQQDCLIMYPTAKSGYVIAKSLKSAVHKISDDSASVSSEDEENTYLPQQSSLLQDLVHTALKIRKDLEDTPGHSAGWGGIDQEHIDKVIPDSLYLFLSVLFGGMAAVSGEEKEDESQYIKRFVSSIAQDIVFGVSKARKLTPKHIGLGLTLHQATRSENLVQLFHDAGHTIGIDTIRRIDTSMANNILKRYEENGFVYIPDGIVPYAPGRVILASCDNIDVLEETIDGKNTFHCTQMMLWQRGPAPQRSDDEHKVDRPRALNHKTIANLHKLDHAKLPRGSRPSPVFHPEIKIAVNEWFTESVERAEAKCKNDAWVLCRMNDYEAQSVPSWSRFNEATSTVDPPVTTAGMLPILQAPADNNDTMASILNRFVNITKHLNQTYTVIVADQPLYSRAKEMVWANQELYENVVMMLGDLHILFNFLKAIGQHFENSGLDDIWVESGLFAQNSVESMMDGKAYYRAVRGHTLAYEALSKIRWEHVLEWMKAEGKYEGAYEVEVEKVTTLFKEDRKGYDGDICDAVKDLTEALHTSSMQSLLKEYDAMHSEEPNYAFWVTYLEMVEILLDYIRANRDGNWKLHLDTFTAMLPYLTIYDHTNYARWGPVYLAEMKNLQTSAPELHREFENGDFVIKRSKGRFNQVPADQATEWQNRTCKISNGIIGITRNDTARDRFCITWAERSHVSYKTKSLYGVENENDEAISTRKDGLPSRVRHDIEAVEKLVELFKKFNVFKLDPSHDGKDLQDESIEHNFEDAGDNAGHEAECEPQLISLATKDVATFDIQKDLLTAKDRGIALVCNNVKLCLIDQSVPFFHPLKRNISKTFGTLYRANITNKNNDKKTLKADRKLIQQLFNASRAGRIVNMKDILTHELLQVPPSLGKVNGKMNSTSKSDMIAIISANVETPPSVPDAAPTQWTCVLIDGHALIQSLGKPNNAQTFNDYAKVFFGAVTCHVKPSVKRVDVVFDTYVKQSIKGPTREKRTGNKRPIRKIIENGDVPLPKVWNQFIALDDNKANLAEFLSDYIMEHGNLPNECELVTGGGFKDHELAKSSLFGDILDLRSNHEEADTRLILHALHAVSNSQCNRIIVVCRDTDVLLLLIHFLGSKQGIDTWMVSGTARQMKCYPIHIIAEKLSLQIQENILGFHALTGCDSTSSFSRFGKKKCWKVFEQHPELLNGVGRDGSVEPIEEYLCMVYSAPCQLGGVNQARHDMFEKTQSELEKLPPTKAALQLHLARANFQAKVWLQSNVGMQKIGLPSATGGWQETDEGLLQVVWSNLPSIPDACVELVTCGCKSKCKTASCKCCKNVQRCIPACTCNAVNCRNPEGRD